MQQRDDLQTDQMRCQPRNAVENGWSDKKQFTPIRLLPAIRRRVARQVAAAAVVKALHVTPWSTFINIDSYCQPL